MYKFRSFVHKIHQLQWFLQIPESWSQSLGPQVQERAPFIAHKDPESSQSHSLHQQMEFAQLSRKQICWHVSSVVVMFKFIAPLWLLMTYSHHDLHDGWTHSISWRRPCDAVKTSWIMLNVCSQLSKCCWRQSECARLSQNHVWRWSSFLKSYHQCYYLLTV